MLVNLEKTCRAQDVLFARVVIILCASIEVETANTAAFKSSVLTLKLLKPWLTPSGACRSSLTSAFS